MQNQCIHIYVNRYFIMVFTSQLVEVIPRRHGVKGWRWDAHITTFSALCSVTMTKFAFAELKRRRIHPFTVIHPFTIIHCLPSFTVHRHSPFTVIHRLPSSTVYRYGKRIRVISYYYCYYYTLISPLKIAYHISKELPGQSRLNRKVLKMVKNEAEWPTGTWRSVVGNPFQVAGPATEKARRWTVGT